MKTMNAGSRLETLAVALALGVSGALVAPAQSLPGGTLNPSNVVKYVTPLVIPPAMPQTAPNYYEISARQFQQQILPTNFPKSTVWGYGSRTTPGTFNYPSFTIEAQVGTPVNVKWINDLVDTNGNYLPHLFAVDPTLHWANPPGPPDAHGIFTNTVTPYTGPVPIVPHLHGGHVEPQSDGYPEAWWLPAASNIPSSYTTRGTRYAQTFTTNTEPGTAVFKYANDQRASTVWFHDHTLGLTRLNVYAGLEGFYLLRGGSDTNIEAQLPGPSPKLGDAPGKKYYEIPLAIQDRSFNSDGSLFFPNSRAFFDGFAGPYVPMSDMAPFYNPEFFGNMMVVNGSTWPVQNVEPRRYRFRMLNGCNARTVMLKLVTDPLAARPVTPAHLMWQIGNDGGFLPAPAKLWQLRMASGERADVVIDFTGMAPGTTLYLINEGPDSPFQGGTVGVDYPAADPATTGQIMKFQVVPLTSVDTSVHPARLVMPAVAPLGAATRTRLLSLNELDSMMLTNPVVGPAMTLLGTVDTNGVSTPLMWSDPITEKPNWNDTETWEVYNYTVDGHPVHLHQVEFEVLGHKNMTTGVVRPPEAWEAGRKDTVIALPGEILQLKANFDIPGRYVWHCHIIDHEDNEMMRAMEVMVSTNADFDGDGLSDWAEVNTYHTDPRLADTDGDGLSDWAEINTYHTNPLLADSDGDGFTDSAEITAGTDPLNAQSYPTWIPGGTLTPGMVSKYVTPLVIPPAMPTTASNYYEIAARQFTQQILPTNFPKSTVWGYGSRTTPGTFNYPAFTIEAQVGAPVQVKWINDLVDTNGNYLPHLFAVDPTLHWANPPGPRDAHGVFSNTVTPYTGPVPIVPHVHGAHATPESDGYPEAWWLPAASNIPPGYFTQGTYYNQADTNNTEPGTAVFRYNNDQRAATVWYHDHALGMTRLNVYAGLEGFYLLRGGADTNIEAQLPGPSPKLGDAPGTQYYEIPLAIQDRSFNSDGSLFFPDSRAFFDGFTGPYFPMSDMAPFYNPEFFGNMMVVNGNTWPVQNVEARRYRFRMLNGCNARSVVLKLVTDPLAARPATPAHVMWQVGNDGGFLPAAAKLWQLRMAPGERADVVIDFTGMAPGTTFYLINEGPDAPFQGGTVNVDYPAADPNTTGQIMKFQVVPLTSVDTSVHPARIVMPAATPLGASVRTRLLSLNELDSMMLTNPMVGPAMTLLGTVDTNGVSTPLMWSSPITETPTLGDTETWEVYNYTIDGHPVHLHQVEFEVLGHKNMTTGVVRPPEAWEVGRKDTVIALPGEILQLKANFDIAGRYVWHCHIIDHEDNEMMRAYDVKLPGSPGGLAALAAGPGVPVSVALTWTNGACPAQGYAIERAQGAGPFSEIARVNAATSSYTDTTAAPLSSYTYRVRGYGNTAYTFYTADAPVTTPDVLATVTLQVNPASGGSATGGGTFVVGSSNTLVATASNSWQFTAWNDGNTNATRTIVVPAINTTYTAGFVELAQLNVLVNTNAGGNVTGAGTFIVGTTNTITATASNRWTFLGWSDGQAGNPRNIVAASGGASFTALFAPTVVLSVQANPATGGDTTGGGTFVVGSNALLAATASNSWQFVAWNDGDTNATRTIVVPAADTTYTAGFVELAAITLALNTNVAGAVAGDGIFVVGTTNAITATASNGWQFIAWHDGVTDNPRNVVVTSGGTNLTAIYAPTVVVSVQGSPTHGGSVAGGGLYVVGSNAVLTAAASNDYEFVGWSDGAASNPRSILVPATNITFTALFEEVAGMQVGVNTNAGGSVSGSGTFEVGSTNTITATASNGWQFLAWSDGSTDATRRVVVTRGGSAYTAIFAQVMSVAVDSSPAEGGSVTGGGLYIVGSNAVLEAVASNSWRFAGWSDGATNNPYTISVPPTNSSFTANFVELAAIACAANTNDGGSVTGGGAYDVGSTNWFTATASNGWQFLGWSDGVTNNPRVVIAAPGGTNLTAVFAPTAVLTLQANPQNGGGVSGGGVWLVGSNTLISATASPLWAFLNWSDGDTNANRSIVMPPTNSTLTANFVELAVFTCAANTNTGGAVTGGGTFVVGSTNWLTATASNGWQFLGWSDGVTNASRALVAAPGGTNLVANFGQLCTVQLACAPANGGSVAGSGLYLVGSNATLTATAAGGWQFLGWSDGATDAVRSITVPLTNTTYTANFVLLAAKLFLQDASGQVVCLLVDSNGTSQTSRVLPMAQTWRLVTAADLDGDGISDLFFQTASGDTAAWLLNTTGAVRSVINWGNLGAWRLRACADYLGAGTPQLFFQREDGLAVYWLMNTNGTVQSTAVLVAAGSWQLRAAGTHTRGGRANLYWQQPTGQLAVWQPQQGGGMAAQLLGNVGPWELCGLVDLDGDDSGDLLWQTQDGNVGSWRMNTNGTARACSYLWNTPWRLKGAGR